MSPLDLSSLLNLSMVNLTRSFSFLYFLRSSRNFLRKGMKGLNSLSLAYHNMSLLFPLHPHVLGNLARYRFLG